MAELRVQLLEMLRQSIRPEFLNRIDDIILFKPLTMSEIQQIVNLQLEGVRRLLAAKNIVLEFSDDLREWLAKAGYDPAYGARPLKRTIQKYVVNHLSEKILSGDVADGEHERVDVNDRGAVEIITDVKPAIVR
jgi:ATP-dependent Clp protease ATP-binding subunit ClpB